jgi:hypothetical protein
LPGEEFSWKSYEGGYFEDPPVTEVWAEYEYIKVRKSEVKGALGLCTIAGPTLLWDYAKETEAYKNQAS